MTIKVFLIAALVKLLLTIEKPFVCAGIYTVVMFALLIAATTFTVAIVAAAIHGAVACLFFWLLQITAGSGAWWVVFVLGILGMVFFL